MAFTISRLEEIGDFYEKIKKKNIKIKNFQKVSIKAQ
jgi:hypothetical protein